MTAGHLPELTSSSHRCTRSHRTAGPRPSLGRGAHRLGQPAPSPDRRRLNLRSHTDTDRLGDSSRCNASHCDASQSGPGQFPRPVPNGSAITSQPSGARLCHLHNVQHKSRCDVQVHSTTFAFSTQSMRSRCGPTPSQPPFTHGHRPALLFQSLRCQSLRCQSIRARTVSTACAQRLGHHEPAVRRSTVPSAQRSAQVTLRCPGPQHHFRFQHSVDAESMLQDDHLPITAIPGTATPGTAISVTAIPGTARPVTAMPITVRSRPL